MLGMPTDIGTEALPSPRVHFCEVVRTRKITPRVQRVTVGGCGLAGFPVAGADAFAYLLLPPAGRDEMSIGLDFDWGQVRSMPREERPRGAYYSIRHHRADALEIDLDVVCHDDGIAAGWAMAATPGDKAALWGPRVLFRPPEHTAWALLVADDTGVPAMLSILEHLPIDHRVLAVAEVTDPAEIRDVQSEPCADLRWVCRSRDEGAADVLRSLRLPPGRGYAWGGGEQAWIQQLDQVVADVHGLAAEQRSLTSYWRQNQPTGLR